MNTLVIIPTHNREEFLPYSLDSVFNQTRKSNEIVVIGNVGKNVCENKCKFIYSDNTI